MAKERDRQAFKRNKGRRSVRVGDRKDLRDINLGSRFVGGWKLRVKRRKEGEASSRSKLDSKGRGLLRFIDDVERNSALATRDLHVCRYFSILVLRGHPFFLGRTVVKEAREVELIIFLQLSLNLLLFTSLPRPSLCLPQDQPGQGLTLAPCLSPNVDLVLVNKRADRSTPWAEGRFLQLVPRYVQYC